MLPCVCVEFCRARQVVTGALQLVTLASALLECWLGVKGC
jgi:hypothetical protein